MTEPFIGAHVLIVTTGQKKTQLQRNHTQHPEGHMHPDSQQGIPPRSANYGPQSTDTMSKPGAVPSIYPDIFEIWGYPQALTRIDRETVQTSTSLRHGRR